MYDENNKYGFVPMNHIAPSPFDINVTDICDVEGNNIPGYKRIERADTGDTLAVHQDNYTVLEYGEANRTIEEVIAESNLISGNMLVHEDMSANGAKYWREYVFPSHEVAFPDGSSQALRIVTKNSYDKSSSFNATAGAFRFVCANGALIGETAGSFSLRHTRNIERQFQSHLDSLIGIAETFDIAMTRQLKWPEIKINHADFPEMLMKGMPQCTENLANQMLAAFISEEPNMWDAYNVLTAWASRPSKGDRKTISDRQERVAKLTTSKAWYELEAA